MKIHTVAASLICLLLLQSCGTFCARGPLDNNVADYYPAVVYDVYVIKDRSSRGFTSAGIITIPFWCIDLIPSSILDTLLLPMDHATVRKTHASHQRSEFDSVLYDIDPVDFKIGMLRFFAEGSPASIYARIFPLANRVEHDDSRTTYVFWYMNVMPHQGHDYWTEVTVNNISQVIETVKTCELLP